MAILHQLKAQGHTVIVTHDPAGRRSGGADRRDPRWRDRPQPASQSQWRVTARPSASLQRRGQFTSGFRALVMAWRAMAANKMRTIPVDHARHYYLYCLGVVSIGGGGCRQQMVLVVIRAIGTNTH